MWRKKKVLIVVGAILLGLAVGCVVRPIIHLLSTSSKDVDEVEPTPPGYINDASRLNQTKVSVWDIPVDHKHPEQQIAALLLRAKTDGKRVSIAGARHSMGGHTIYPDGIVINMLPWNRMRLDESHDILTVQSGATWKDVIHYLDQRGKSVAIMQSNNSFSVGGSISVNCHGWQFDRPPIASSVESFRLMKADGRVVRCSRRENVELFSLALGGYGLFGVILEVDLHVRDNQRYRLEQYIVPVEEALTTFDANIAGNANVDMVYARMNIAAETFLKEVVINAFHRDDDGPIPELEDASAVALRRSIFRGSADSEYGKQLRWSAETKLQPLLSNKIFSRNQLMNESVEVFENRSAKSTDILHEYFVPRHRVVGFVDSLRRLIPQHGGNLLNVTVRDIRTDHDTFLRYADQPMLAFVMLFVQEKTDKGEQQMQSMTRALIDAVLQHEGRFYLPYRLHATPKQLHAAYPQAREFFRKKRQWDPDELFQNQFYKRYGK